MPANEHLEWMELTDFTPGLYARFPPLAMLQMPENAATQMDDCYALPEGGIRPFFRHDSISTSGITTASQACTGISAHSGKAQRSGAGNDAQDRYLATMSSADNKHRLYRMDGSNAETVWKQIAAYTLSAGTSSEVKTTSFRPFLDSSGNLFMLYVARYNHADAGLYKVAYVPGAGPPGTDGLSTKINGKTGPLAVNQARIFIGNGDGTQNFRLWYGDVGLTAGTLTTPTNFVDISPYQDGSGLLAIEPQEPSDLLIGREGAPWVAVQGDISSASTAIRDMGTGVTPSYAEQDLVRTPKGIAFIGPGGRIYLTNGRDFEPISRQIEPFYKVGGAGSTPNVIAWGKMAFMRQWLFCPDGFIYDLDTGAWFMTTGVAGVFWHASERQFSVWGVESSTGFAVGQYYPYDDIGVSAAKRVSSFTWRSAPWAQKSGRETRIREVEVFFRAQAASDITLERHNADDAGTETRTLTGFAAGRHKATFLFTNKGSEYQDISVNPSAQTGSDEAPTIERIRVGFAPGRRSY